MRELREVREARPAGAAGAVDLARAAKASPTSSSSSTSSTRTIPHCRSAASTTRSVEASAPVCDAAARWPASDRPALRTATGFPVAARARSRSMSVSDSTYASTPWQSSRRASSSMTSSAVMSASLPVLTTQPSPSPRSKARLTAPYPSAPLWVTNARVPGTSAVEAPLNSGEKDATSPDATPTAPIVLGPNSRRFPARADSATCRCRSAPDSPVSANPLEQTIATRTPAATQSSTAAGTRSAATMSIARSTGSAHSFTDAYDASPRTGAPSGRTGKTDPAKAYRWRNSTGSRPNEPGLSLAPTTATERAAQRASRASSVPTERLLEPP